MRTRMIVFLLIPILCACGSGQSADAVSQRKLVLAGASTIQPIMDEIAPMFEEAHPGVRVEVQGGGSSVGIKNPREGKADIGMVSRSLKEDEKDLFGTKIAEDGIAIFVHKDNPLQEISREQVIRLYTGEIKNWKELGGPDLPITLITKEEGRSTLELFEQHFDLKGKIAKDALVIGPNGQAIKTVEGNPSAVAYVSVGSAEKAVELGSPIKLLALDGVAATVENIKNGSYPLRRPLHLVTKGEPTGLAKELIDFVLSPEGQKVVTGLEFVPVAR